MSRVALRKQDDYVASQIDSMDWWGDFDIDVPPQKPKFRVYENPKYAKGKYYQPAQKKKSMNSAIAFLAVVMFFTLSIFQISRIAALSEKGKQIASLKSEIKTIEQENETKELRLLMQQNIDRVRDIATRELGMTVPTEEQTIVLRKNTADNLFTYDETTEDGQDDVLEAMSAP